MRLADPWDEIPRLESLLEADLLASPSARESGVPTRWVARHPIRLRDWVAIDPLQGPRTNEAHSISRSRTPSPA